MLALNLLSGWYSGSFLGIKLSKLEAYHLPPSSSEIKNGENIPPFPHTFLWHWI
jgi:hypothetical protein